MSERAEYGRSQITRWNLAAELIGRFPVLRARIEKVQDDGLHLVGSVVNRDFLEPALDRHEMSDGELAAMFAFIEEMATSPDGDVSNVVEVTICESLGDDPARLRRARELMGPVTLKLSHEIEQYLGREWSDGEPRGR